ncbi:MAG: DNA polymerase IV [Caulobacterales bacterium]|nr:DNA polymerase IV [Caulobacterales bacterium]
MNQGWCRDCCAPAPPDADRCGSCRGRRLIRHDELASLSIAHVDCDAFYAAIEKRDAPELADQPVIIGGGRRGVVSTACYLARAFGVRSAMPMFKARRACPQAVIVKPRMSVYVAESRRIRALFDAVTPLVEPMSIDEAFLDLSGTERVHSAPPALTLIRLQAQIEREIGVSVSIGLSFNKFLAKTASDLDKPRGFAVIGRGEALAFLAPRPVSSIYGVGPAFARKLARDGLRTIADLRARSDAALARAYGEEGLRLARLARGEDARRVSSSRGRKSISSETTFGEDLADRAALEARLWGQCVRVSDRAKAAGLAGRVVTLKLKSADHAIRTRRRTLSAPTQLADSLFRESAELLAAEATGARFRLIGVGLSALESAGGDAGDLLDPNAQKRAAAERAVDAAREKFGADAVVKGRALRDRKGE